MKKIVSLVVLAAFAFPILVGCGESTEKVNSTTDPGTIKVDSSAAGKKGAQENDKGLNN